MNEHARQLAKLRLIMLRKLRGQNFAVSDNEIIPANRVNEFRWQGMRIESEIDELEGMLSDRP